MTPLALLPPGCAGDGAPPPPAHSARPAHTADAHTADAHTAEVWPVVDCADLVAEPAPVAVAGARASHDVVFDDAGNLVGGDDVGLWRFPRGGAGVPWVVGLGPTHQLAWLPGGELAVMVATTGSLERVLPGGGRIPLGPGGYAVRAGPDGWLWLADGQRIARVDPTSGAVREVALALPDGRPKVLQFAADGRSLFVGTIEGSGTVWRAPLDAAGAPEGAPTAFATVGGGWHDALALDACGNLYVTDALTTDLYRLDASGALTFTLPLPTEGHAHGLGFGSGDGGWRADALYLAQPYGGDTVAELVVGVPAADWRGGRYTVVE
jgi:hypothetical protein